MTNEQTEFPLGDVTLEDALSAGLAPPPQKWARTLADMIDLLTADRQRRGEDLEAALADAQRTVSLLADNYGGHELYFPRGTALLNAIRDRVIYQLARRGNIDSLAERYSLTQRRIRQIVAEQHAIQVRDRQSRLFPT